MKVKTLIQTLKAVDPEATVILQKDAEGNGYEVLRVVDNNCTWAREGHEIVVGVDHIYDGMLQEGYGPEDYKLREDLNPKKAVVLTP